MRREKKRGNKNGVMGRTTEGRRWMTLKNERMFSGLGQDLVIIREREKCWVPGSLATRVLVALEDVRKVVGYDKCRLIPLGPYFSSTFVVIASQSESSLPASFCISTSLSQLLLCLSPPRPILSACVPDLCAVLLFLGPSSPPLHSR